MRYIYVALASACLLGAMAPAASAEDAWKKNARWCVTDTGAANRRYLSVCAAVDQYDSVLFCQQHNEAARKTIVAAGAGAVNGFMKDIAPSFCKG